MQLPKVSEKNKFLKSDCAFRQQNIKYIFGTSKFDFSDMVMVCAVAIIMCCSYIREENIKSMKFKARIFLFFKAQNIYVKCYTPEYQTRYFLKKSQ